MKIRRPAGRQRGAMQEGNGETNRPPIRVLLADDHTLFRQGLAGLLAAYGGLEIIAEVPNDQEALRLAQQQKPDVVLMQVQMPFERAKESLLKMRDISPPPKVVIVTMFEEPRYIRELMNLGASAYLLKSVSIEHLTGAVRAAVFDPEGHHVVVGMPPRDYKGGRGGVGGCTLGEGNGDTGTRRPGPLKRPDSELASAVGGHGEAPPGQRLPQDERLVQGRGRKEGPVRKLDHHRRHYQTGRRARRRRRRRTQRRAIVVSPPPLGVREEPCPLETSPH
jgi:CheY-like chemotaxis protein